MCTGRSPWRPLPMAVHHHGRVALPARHRRPGHIRDPRRVGLVWRRLIGMRISTWAAAIHTGQRRYRRGEHHALRHGRLHVRRGVDTPRRSGRNLPKRTTVALNFECRGTLFVGLFVGLVEAGRGCLECRSVACTKPAGTIHGRGCKEGRKERAAQDRERRQAVKHKSKQRR